MPGHNWIEKGINRGVVGYTSDGYLWVQISAVVEGGGADAYACFSSTGIGIYGAAPAISTEEPVAQIDYTE